MLQVATASIEDMRDLSRAPLTLLASLISVSCLSLCAYSVTDVCQEGTASAQSHDNLPGMATLLHVVVPNCGNMQHVAGRCMFGGCICNVCSCLYAMGSALAVIGSNGLYVSASEQWLPSCQVLFLMEVLWKQPCMQRARSWFQQGGHR